MNIFMVVFFMFILFVIAILWVVKLVVECEPIDVLGLAASCLALGYLAGAWL